MRVHFPPKTWLLLAMISVVSAAGLAAVQPGAWWTGWLGFSALFLLGLAALHVVWRWAGTGKSLAWMIGLALLLRVGAGVGTYLALPVNGNDSRTTEPATCSRMLIGAMTRLGNWHNPASHSWRPSIRSFYTDQYGGLLALSALTYEDVFARCAPAAD